MLSEQAVKVIAGMKENWKNRKPVDPDMDPKLAALQKIYDERAVVDDPNRVVTVPDQVSVTPEMADGVYGEWLRYLDDAPDKDHDHVVLFLHGGGFQTGSCLSRRNMASKVSLYGKMDTFIINYRLAPEYHYPAEVEDCVKAYIWLIKKGYHPWNITVVGESAGAALTLCMCHFLRDHDLPLPGRICPFSAPSHVLNLTASRFYNLPYDAMLGHDATEEEINEGLEKLKRGEVVKKFSFYANEEEADSPYASPIMGSFKGFPKTLLEVGEKELLYEDSLMIYKKMKEEGVDVTLHAWEGLFHVFALLPMPESEEVMQEIAAFAAGK